MKIKKWILPLAASLLTLAFILLTCRVTIVADVLPQTQVNAQGETVLVTQLTFAEQYTLDNWDSLILPTVRERAVDLSEFIPAIANDLAAAGEKYGNRDNETSPWSFCLKGRVKVLEIESPDKASKTRLVLDTMPYDGIPDIKLQVSTVLKTNAIRDGVGFLKLDDFTNQVEFAELTKAFNNKIKSSVLNELDASALAGREINLLGCVSIHKADLEELLIIPIELETWGGK